jgi:hypothetical protein
MPSLGVRDGILIITLQRWFGSFSYQLTAFSFQLSVIS